MIVTKNDLIERNDVLERLAREVKNSVSNISDCIKSISLVCTKIEDSEDIVSSVINELDLKSKVIRDISTKSIIESIVTRQAVSVFPSPDASSTSYAPKYNQFQHILDMIKYKSFFFTPKTSFFKASISENAPAISVVREILKTLEYSVNKGIEKKLITNMTEQIIEQIKQCVNIQLNAKISIEQAYNSIKTDLLYEYSKVLEQIDVYSQMLVDTACHSQENKYSNMLDIRKAAVENDVAVKIQKLTSGYFHRCSIMPKFYYSPEEHTITVKGFAARSFHIPGMVQSHSKKFITDASLKIDIISTKFTIDQSLTFPDTNIHAIAPIVDVSEDSQIILSGNDAGSYKENAKTGNSGKAGKDGMSGGDFLMIGQYYHHLDKLSVESDGGDGGDGQNGGQGKRILGQENPMNSYLIQNCKSRLIQRIPYAKNFSDFLSDHHTHKLVFQFYDSKECTGKKGRIGCSGGKGGEGGAAGLVEMFDPLQKTYIKTLQKNGRGGDGGKGGDGGDGQKNGDSILVTIYHPCIGSNAKKNIQQIQKLAPSNDSFDSYYAKSHSILEPHRGGGHWATKCTMRTPQNPFSKSQIMTREEKKLDTYTTSSGDVAAVSWSFNSMGYASSGKKGKSGKKTSTVVKKLPLNYIQTIHKALEYYRPQLIKEDVLSPILEDFKSVLAEAEQEFSQMSGHVEYSDCS